MNLSIQWPETPASSGQRIGLICFSRQLSGDFRPTLRVWPKILPFSTGSFERYCPFLPESIASRLVRCGLVRGDVDGVDGADLHRHLLWSQDPAFWTESRMCSWTHRSPQPEQLLPQPYIMGKNNITLAATGHTLKVTEIEPGTWVSDLPREAVPRYGFIRFQRLANGDFRPLMVSWPQVVTLDSELPKKLGVNLDPNTFVRLIRNGYIKASQFSPRRYLIFMDSFYEHLENTQKSGFWAGVKDWFKVY
jgi:hypothetical protein